jgi:hypothetical protein
MKNENAKPNRKESKDFRTIPSKQWENGLRRNLDKSTPDCPRWVPRSLLQYHQYLAPTNNDKKGKKLYKSNPSLSFFISFLLCGSFIVFLNDRPRWVLEVYL